MAGRVEPAPDKTRLMIAVNESNLKGYPHPSISSNGAFEWILNKIIGTNTSAFKFLFLHVQVPDEEEELFRASKFLMSPGNSNLRVTNHIPSLVKPKLPKTSDKFLSPEGISNLRVTNHMPSLVKPKQPKTSNKSLSPEGFSNLSVTDHMPSLVKPRQPKTSDKSLSPEGISNLKVTNLMPLLAKPKQPKTSDKCLAPEAIYNLRVTTPTPWSVKPGKLTTSDKCLSLEGFDDMDGVYASPDDFKNMKCQDKKRGLHLLEHFVNICHELGIDCEAWIKRGDPKIVILQEVKRVGPDMLVVGSRGLGPFQKIFVGNVSEFCAKQSMQRVLLSQSSVELKSLPMI